MKNISEPVDLIELNLNDRIIQLIVDETNQYATYHMTGNPEQASNSFVGMCRPVDCKKMKTFLGLFILSGILRKPSIKMYWSVEDLISTPVFSRIMTQNWFQLIQKFTKDAYKRSAPFLICLERYSKTLTSLVITLVLMSPLQVSTITRKLLHMVTHVCQNFGIHDVHGQTPKSICPTSYLLPSDLPYNFS